MAEQGAKGSIAGIIKSLLLKMACRISAGMICAVHCTFLLKEAFNPKVLSKLMGHKKKLIAVDVYVWPKPVIKKRWRIRADLSSGFWTMQKCRGAFDVCPSECRTVKTFVLKPENHALKGILWYTDILYGYGRFRNAPYLWGVHCAGQSHCGGGENPVCWNYDNLKKCRIQSKCASKVKDIRKGLVCIRLSSGVNAVIHACYDYWTPGKKDDVSFKVTRFDKERELAVRIITRIIRHYIYINGIFITLKYWFMKCFIYTEFWLNTI